MTQRSVRDRRYAELHLIRQWSGIYGEAWPEPAGSCRRSDTVYRTRKSMGERIYRFLQRKTKGRFA